jgi:hypothetical protein
MSCSELLERLERLERGDPSSSIFTLLPMNSSLLVALHCSLYLFSVPLSRPQWSIGTTDTEGHYMFRIQQGTFTIEFSLGKTDKFNNKLTN